jgi:hypothetical protein
MGEQAFVDEETARHCHGGTCSSSDEHMEHNRALPHFHQLTSQTAY